MKFEEQLINIDLEDVKTLEEVQHVIRKINIDGGSMKPFAFEINKEIQTIILGRLTLEHGTFFGVPFKTVDRIDKKKVEKVIDKMFDRFESPVDFCCDYDRENAAKRLKKELGLE